MERKYFFSTFCIVFSTTLAHAEIDIPSYYPRCYRDDPNLNDCLLKATEQVRPFLQKGVPELNMPPISPFTIPEVSLQQGNDAVNYKASLKNLVLNGLDTYKFKRFEFDTEKLKFYGEVDFLDLYVKGDYEVNGKILSFPIQGKGILYINTTNCNGTFHEDAKLVMKKGVTYLVPNKTKIKIHIGAVNSKLDGLFDGNEQLAKVTNDVIQDNIELLVEEVKPAVEQVLTKIVEDLMFKSISKVPYDRLYPLRGQ